MICEKVSELKGNMGYNAATGEFEDLVKSGIIDPTKVTRSALQNAASVATLLLTSDALIAEKPKKEDKKGGGHGESRRHVLSGRPVRPSRAIEEPPGLSPVVFFYSSLKSLRSGAVGKRPQNDPRFRVV